MLVRPLSESVALLCGGTAGIGLASYGEAQFWFAGVASTRARVILVAILVAELKRPGPFSVPGLVAQGDSSEQQRLRQSVPTLRHVLLDPAESILR